MLPILILSLCPALNHGLAPPPSAALITKSWTPTTALMARKPWSGISSGRVDGLNGFNDKNILWSVRGGGDTDDGTTADSDEESYEYDDTSDDDETDVEEAIDGEDESEATEDGETDNEQSPEEEATDEEDESEATDEGEADNEPSPEQVERAQKYTQLSSQSRNFGITTALWGSLFFDTILNHAKRADLFPISAAAGAGSTLLETIVPTALLASGFGLAGGASFLLWRDLVNRAEMISSDDGESSKGDWFLNLSSVGSDGKDSESLGKITSQARTRLFLHLSLFGMLNLGAHAGYYFSDQAPFLGMSAAIINVHNTLTCISALMKEEGLKEFLVKSISWPLQLFKGKEGGGGKSRLELTSFLFQLSTIAVWVRCIPICKYLIAFVTSQPAVATESAAIINNAREFSLKIASLARLTLLAGVTHTLYTVNKNDTSRHHPLFAVLSGMVGLGCLGAGGTMLFDSFRSLSPATNMLGGAVAGRAMIVIFGLFAGYNSIFGLRSFFQDQKQK